MEMLNHSKDASNQILTRTQFEKITDCLSGLAEKLRVSMILLVNSSGQIVAERVSSSWQGDSTVLSTLTASSYAASKEMARLLGEVSNFQMVLYEGHHQNMMMAKINADFFLAVAFEKGVAIGMVRLFTKKTIEQLLPILHQGKEDRDEIKKIFDHEFQNLLGDALDRSFKESLE
ncbi:roadblock/LC7 domain-containing protein [bacterium]|nr:roadblock/LC7 domain-containing protein [bacterium]